MRLDLTKLAAPLTLLTLAVAAGCRDASRDATSNDALRRDLELAQASTVALAPRDLPATRFISAIEAGERPTSGSGRAANPTHRSPHRAPQHAAQHNPAPPAPTEIANTDGQAKAGEEIAPAPAPVETHTASNEPAPSPTEGTGSADNDGVISVSPTTGGGDGGVTVSRRGRGGGLGGIFGGIIGVVIRGGSIGDDDHCERDHPRGGGGYPIGRGYPGGAPVGFPSGGIGLPRSGVGRTPRPGY